MSKVEDLRAFVKEPLASFSAFDERMRAQNEEELRRSEEENRRKQWTLNQVLIPRVVLHRLGPGLDRGLPQDLTETQQIKEEPEETSVKQEEVEIPVYVHKQWGNTLSN